MSQVIEPSTLARARRVVESYREDESRARSADLEPHIFKMHAEEMAATIEYLLGFVSGMLESHEITKKASEERVIEVPAVGESEADFGLSEEKKAEIRSIVKKGLDDKRIYTHELLELIQDRVRKHGHLPVRMCIEIDGAQMDAYLEDVAVSVSYKGPGDQKGSPNDLILVSGV